MSHNPLFSVIEPREKFESAIPEHLLTPLTPEQREITLFAERHEEERRWTREQLIRLSKGVNDLDNRMTWFDSIREAAAHYKYLAVLIFLAATNLQAFFKAVVYLLSFTHP